MTYTAKNTFHGTTVRFRCKTGDLWLTDAKFRSIKRKLCGMRGCECGGLRGEPGSPALSDALGLVCSLVPYTTVSGAAWLISY